MGFYDVGAPKDMAAFTQDIAFPQQGGSIPRAAQVPPFWQIKPPEGVDLYSTATAVVPAGAGNTVTFTPARPWRSLPGYNATLAGLQIAVIAPLATLDVVFTLLNNSGPVQGWDAFTLVPVAANAIIQPFLGPLQLPQSSNLTVLATNNGAGGPWTVKIDLVGWMWPIVSEIETFGQA